MRKGTVFLLALLFLPAPFTDRAEAQTRSSVAAGIEFESYSFKTPEAIDIKSLSLFTIPFGVGVKHYCRPGLALRTSLMDNLSIGSQGLETMHNLSLSVGVEVHFGGPRQTYFPYHGGGMIW